MITYHYLRSKAKQYASTVLKNHLLALGIITLNLFVLAQVTAQHHHYKGLHH